MRTLGRLVAFVRAGEDSGPILGAWLLNGRIALLPFCGEHAQVHLVLDEVAEAYVGASDRALKALARSRAKEAKA